MLTSLHLQAIASIDTNIADMGERALLYLTMGTIYYALKKFFTWDKAEDTDLLQEALIQATDTFRNLNPKIPFRIQLYTDVQHVAQRRIADREVMPISWVMRGIHRTILSRLKAESDLAGCEDEKSLRAIKMANELQEVTGLGWRPLLRFINKRARLQSARANLVTTDAWSEHLEQEEIRQVRLYLNDILDGTAPSNLKEKERFVLMARYGFLPHQGKGFTLDETGALPQLQVGRERVRQVEAKAKRRLRDPLYAQRLKPEEREEAMPEKKVVYQRPLTFADLERMELNQLHLTSTDLHKLLEANLTTIDNLTFAPYERLVEILGRNRAREVKGRLISYRLRQFDKTTAVISAETHAPAEITRRPEKKPDATLVANLQISKDTKKKLIKFGLTEIDKLQEMPVKELQDLPGFTIAEINEVLEALSGLP